MDILALLFSVTCGSLLTISFMEKKRLSVSVWPISPYIVTIIMKKGYVKRLPIMSWVKKSIYLFVVSWKRLLRSRVTFLVM